MENGHVNVINDNNNNNDVDTLSFKTPLRYPLLLTQPALVLIMPIHITRSTIIVKEAIKGNWKTDSPRQIDEPLIHARYRHQ
jgi:hypothetical protein